MFGVIIFAVNQKITAQSYETENYCSRCGPAGNGNGKFAWADRHFAP
jgi:hypothetical protein